MQVLGLGTKLYAGDGEVSEAFSEVADIREWSSPPGITVGTEETTNHSQSHFFRQKRPTLLKVSAPSVVLLFDPSRADHDGMLSKLLARARRNFKVRFPTDPVMTWKFAALVTSFQPQITTDALLKANAAMEGSGPLTISNAPIVESVEDTGSDGPAYVETETMEFTATFDQNVVVTGSPRITVNFAGVGGDVLLTYASGSGTAALVFSLTVGAAGVHQADLTEVTMAAQDIDLNGGSITDEDGNPVRLRITADEIGDLTGVSVNA